MWTVETFPSNPRYAGRYYLQRARGMEDTDFWPNVGGDPIKDFVDLGVAVTMCDVFNARDYPGEVLVGGPTNLLKDQKEV